ncbi:MAG: hypothetical protein AAFQ80_16715 [Cyanobacteria bacterium J06621_8]
MNFTIDVGFSGDRLSDNINHGNFLMTSDRLLKIKRSPLRKLLLLSRINNGSDRK